MGIEIPGWLRWVGDLIGEPFPEGDETACRRQADRWRDYADQLERHKDGLTAATRTTLEGFISGEIHNKLDQRLKPFVDGPGSIDTIAGQLRQLAEAVDNVATEIEFAKEMFIANLVALAATLAALAASAWINWGAPVEAAAAVAVAEAAISQIIRAAVAKVAEEAVARVIAQIVTRALMSAAINAGISAGLNAGIQSQQMLQGNRRGFDSESFWNDVEGGAVSGAVMGPILRGAHDVDAGSALANRAKNFGASFVGNAGGTLAAQQALTGHMNFADAAGAGLVFGGVDGLQRPAVHPTGAPEITALTGDRPVGPVVNPEPATQHSPTPPVETTPAPAGRASEFTGPAAPNVDVPFNLGSRGQDAAPLAPSALLGTDPGIPPHTATPAGAHAGVLDAPSTGSPSAGTPAVPAGHASAAPTGHASAPSGSPPAPVARAGVAESGAASAGHPAGAPAARISDAPAGAGARDVADTLRTSTGTEPATHPVRDAGVPARDSHLPRDPQSSTSATPLRDSQPPREVPPPRDAPPVRDTQAPRDGQQPRRDGAPPRDGQVPRDGQLSARRDEHHPVIDRVSRAESASDHARDAGKKHDSGSTAEASLLEDATTVSPVVTHMSPDGGHSAARPTAPDLSRAGGPDRSSGPHDPTIRRPGSDGYHGGDDMPPPPAPGPLDPAGFDNPADHRVYGPKQLAPVEDPAHQSAVREALTNQDGSYATWADPRTHPYGELINDGGPSVAGRANNCLDTSLAALASFHGHPTVAAPRYEANRLGEAGGLARAKAWLGDGLHQYQGMSIPKQFAALHERIKQMGPGSSALVVNGWQKFDGSGKPLFKPDGTPELDGAHATVIVYPRDASGPVWWDPQQNRTFDQPPPRFVDKSAYLHFTAIAPDHFGPITPRQGGHHGATGHPGPSAGLPGSDRSEHLLRSSAVRDGLDLLADPDTGGSHGQRGGGLDETRDRFANRGRDGVSELVDRLGGGGLRRGEAERATAAGPADLSLPMEHHDPTRSGGFPEHRVSDDRGFVDQPAGTHSGSPPDHRQADAAERPAGHAVERGEGPRGPASSAESGRVAGGDHDGVLEPPVGPRDAGDLGPHSEDPGHHHVDPGDRGRHVPSHPDSEHSRGIANEALWKRIPPVRPDELRHHLGDSTFGEQRAKDNVTWWRELTGEEQRALIDTYSREIGNAEGVPAWARTEANDHQLSQLRDELHSRRGAGERLTRTDIKELARYDNIRRALDNARAELVPRGGEVHILAFDPYTFHGDGRIVVSVGHDPHHAESVSWHVPGITTTIASLPGNLTNALNHWESVRRENPSITAASIAWIGYDAPSGIGLLRTPFHGLARVGGAILHDDIAAFNAAVDAIASSGDHFRDNHIFGHSYGSTATSYAGRDGRLAGHVRSVTLLGSPGAAKQHHASDFGIGDRVFVASSSRDPVTATGGRTPASRGRFFGIGLGIDPAMRSFGAQRITAEFPRHMDTAETKATHTAYYHIDPRLGVRTESLANFGRIAAGHFDQVHVEAHRTERPLWKLGWRTDEPAQGRPLKLEPTNGEAYSVERRIWDPGWHSDHSDAGAVEHQSRVEHRPQHGAVHDNGRCAHEVTNFLSERYGRDVALQAKPGPTGVPARHLFEAWGSGSLFATYADIHDTLLHHGDGSAALLASRWSRGPQQGGHAYIAVNEGGVVHLYERVGDQFERSGWPPSWGQGAVDRTAVGYLDRRGRPIDPLDGRPDELRAAEEVGNVAGNETSDDAPAVASLQRDYNANGHTIPTDQLVHPQSGLLDHRLLDSAAVNPTRVSDALAPGVPSRHPEVQDMVANSYDPHAGLGEEAWNSHYWPTGKRDGHGNPELVWPDPDVHPQGFDTPESRTPVVLNPGQFFDRFGPGFGVFGSPTGTPFPNRGLPPHSLEAGFHRYEVLRPLPVWEGPIAPAMGQPGGGTQYYFPRPIVDLVNAGYLREIPL
ncbi:hypothetical protein MKUB_50020 [Mycobacterium kubicae]|uniref:Glycohydrolase toxin TNT-related protein n=1 Tax=Mycobacterium kubicae TaxID=120959 RepID=A0AAX1J4W6_9MYCO|nr:glycohydrolase toxin TNT-related protein [Mycobacterium kubicae]MCV7094672.1 glycohydrolase toxin TNT-related protein [Mycobacterium kubicae]ORV97639.1 hypothetical protein AWC13_15500 [Mycobacterium kubicae]QNI13012.1 DUF4237 domain-containing protein [Mycobacterium kubicae]QPI36528.1 glycohydrolase toxin TNT-related protein [Mycobacterium kubicae]GFG67512.1 hypothetical protein MKUB_50020 [Mycobacterium kubicae]